MAEVEAAVEAVEVPASPVAALAVQFRQPLPRTVSKALALAGVGASTSR